MTALFSRRSLGSDSPNGWQEKRDAAVRRKPSVMLGKVLYLDRLTVSNCLVVYNPKFDTGDRKRSSKTNNFFVLFL